MSIIYEKVLQPFSAITILYTASSTTSRLCNYLIAIVAVCCTQAAISQNSPNQIIENLVDNLKHNFSLARTDSSLLLRFDCLNYGNARNGNTIVSEWKSITTSRLYDDGVRVDGRSTQSQVLGENVADYKESHSFWDGNRGLRFTSVGPSKSEANVFGVMTHSEDESRRFSRDTRYGGEIRGFVLGDVSFEETYAELFGRLEAAARVQSNVIDGALIHTISVEDGTWFYDVQLTSVGSEYRVTRIITEKIAELPEGVTEFRYTLLPESYEIIKGSSTITSGTLEEYVVRMDGSIRTNTTEFKISAVEFNPGTNDLELYSIDVPDGTLVSDFTYPGIHYRVQNGSLEPDYSLEAVNEIDASIDILSEKGISAIATTPEVPTTVKYSGAVDSRRTSILVIVGAAVFIVMGAAVVRFSIRIREARSKSGSSRESVQ